MKKKRHTTEEIIRILRKADEGQTVEEVCREVNISEQTFYRWSFSTSEIDDTSRQRVDKPEIGITIKMLKDYQKG